MIKILDFYSDWCKPCQQLAPILSEIERDLDFVDIERIDIEEDSENLCDLYNIRSIPTLIIFKDGKKRSTIIGLTHKMNLLNIINDLVNENGTQN